MVTKPPGRATVVSVPETVSSAQFIFLGSGSAFTVDAANFQSNVLLKTEDGRRLLIDCGSDVRMSARLIGLDPRSLTDIYISHLHSDHVGGLEWIGLSTMFDPESVRPRLYICEDIADMLWENSLKGGLGWVTGKDTCMSDFFDVIRPPADGSFEWAGITFDLVPAQHVVAASRTIYSYGLSFSIGGQRVFFTSDTQFTPDRLRAHYDAADIIFHDCESATIRSGVHAHFEELCELPAAIRAKTWLYHYQPGALPDPAAHGFAGFVKRGQAFSLGR